MPQEALLAGLPAASGMVAGELVEPESVAALVAYLASPLAAGATGHDHVVDGGAVETARARDVSQVRLVSSGG